MVVTLVINSGISCCGTFCASETCKNLQSWFFFQNESIYDCVIAHYTYLNLNVKKILAFNDKS